MAAPGGRERESNMYQVFFYSGGLVRWVKGVCLSHILLLINSWGAPLVVRSSLKAEVFLIEIVKEVMSGIGEVERQEQSLEEEETHLEEWMNDASKGKIFKMGKKGEAMKWRKQIAFSFTYYKRWKLHI